MPPKTPEFSVLRVDEEEGIVVIASDTESVLVIQQATSPIVGNLCQRYGTWAVKVLGKDGVQIGPILASTTKDPRKNKLSQINTPEVD